MKARLVGPFALFDNAGRDITPRGKKACGVLALLLTVPERRRTRRWIESKLWSDRFHDNASGSLRAELVKIRKASPGLQTALGTDRNDIWLDGVDIDTDADEAALNAGREFLEGLGITDPAFLAWQEDERRRLRPDATFVAGAEGTGLAPHSGRPITIVLDSPPTHDHSASFVASRMAQAIGAVIAEFAAVEVFDLSLSATQSAAEIIAPGQGFVITVVCNMTPDGLHCNVKVFEPGSGKITWWSANKLPKSINDAVTDNAFSEMVFHAADAAYAASIGMARHFSEPAWVASMTASAVRAIYSFDAERLRMADRTLAQVIEIAPSARAYAWRGHLRQIMAVERTEPDWAAMREEADEYAIMALEMTSGNPLVLALVSQIRTMLDNDGAIGFQLAREAHEASPYNGFALAAMSGASLRLGRHDDALRFAEAGAKIGARTVYSGWWHALAGLSAMALGRIEDSLAHYQIAHVRAMRFRAPMRHLYFMYLAAGEHEKAARMLHSLQRVEPDFSISLVRDNPDYPISTLRKTSLLDRALMA